MIVKVTGKISTYATARCGWTPFSCGADSGSHAGVLIPVPNAWRFGYGFDSETMAEGEADHPVWRLRSKCLLGGPSMGVVGAASAWGISEDASAKGWRH